MNINELMGKYLTFLNSSLPAVLSMVGELEEDEEVLYDWMQASWEMIVESVLFYGEKRYLPIYGQGADLGEDSSRVSNTKCLPTDEIKCSCRATSFDYISKNNLEINNFDFEEFVNWDGHWYSVLPPLNSILLSKGNLKIVVDINNVDFILTPISK